MMKIKLILFSFLMFLISFSGFSQSGIKWLTWEEMMNQQKVTKKKVMIDLYTDWCGWCKKMDKTTFENPVISDYLNKNFYSVKFNAEQKEDLTFESNTFKFVENGRRGYHQFAAAITQNQLSYPTYVFMNEDLQVLQVIPGYQEAKSFEYILNFFGGNYYKTVPWTKFEQDFQSKL